MTAAAARPRRTASRSTSTGRPVAVTRANNAAYVAMENTATPLQIGRESGSWQHVQRRPRRAAAVERRADGGRDSGRDVDRSWAAASRAWSATGASTTAAGPTPPTVRRAAVRRRCSTARPGRPVGLRFPEGDLRHGPPSGGRGARRSALGVPRSAFRFHERAPHRRGSFAVQDCCRSSGCGWRTCQRPRSGFVMGPGVTVRSAPASASGPADRTTRRSLAQHRASSSAR